MAHPHRWTTTRARHPILGRSRLLTHRRHYTITNPEFPAEHGFLDSPHARANSDLRDLFPHDHRLVVSPALARRETVEETLAVETQPRSDWIDRVDGSRDWFLCQDRFGRFVRGPRDVCCRSQLQRELPELVLCPCRVRVATTGLLVDVDLVVPPCDVVMGSMARMVAREMASPRLEELSEARTFSFDTKEKIDESSSTAKRTAGIAKGRQLKASVYSLS